MLTLALIVFDVPDIEIVDVLYVKVEIMITFPVVVIVDEPAVNVTVLDIVKSTQARLRFEVLKVPPDNRKFPTHVRLLVDILIEPLVTVRL